MLIQENDHVLLCSADKRKTWLLKIEKGKQFHTHRGVVDLEQAIGCEYGARIQSHAGAEFFLFDPIPSDYAHKFYHRTQALFPKDMGLSVSIFGIIGIPCNAYFVRTSLSVTTQNTKITLNCGLRKLRRILTD